MMIIRGRSRGRAPVGDCLQVCHSFEFKFIHSYYGYSKHWEHWKQNACVTVQFPRVFRTASMSFLRRQNWLFNLFLGFLCKKTFHLKKKFFPPPTVTYCKPKAKAMDSPRDPSEPAQECNHADVQRMCTFLFPKLILLTIDCQVVSVAKLSCGQVEDAIPKFQSQRSRRQLRIWSLNYSE
jgi:hypothetical protein